MFVSTAILFSFKDKTSISIYPTHSLIYLFENKNIQSILIILINDDESGDYFQDLLKKRLYECFYIRKWAYNKGEVLKNGDFIPIHCELWVVCR